MHTTTPQEQRCRTHDHHNNGEGQGHANQPVSPSSLLGRGSTRQFTSIGTLRIAATQIATTAMATSPIRDPLRNATSAWEATDKDDDTIPYKAPIHHLRRFGCFVSRLISAAQRRGELGPRSKLGCMMEEVHLRVLDTENMEHGHPSRGKRDNHHHHHEDQRIAGKHREFITGNGCPNGGGKAMASLSREATMHAQWQLADA